MWISEKKHDTMNSYFVCLRDIPMKIMKHKWKRAFVPILCCLILFSGNEWTGVIRSLAAEEAAPASNAASESGASRNMYDEMVFWGESAAWLYYFASISGYQPESVLYYYCEKDTQEDIVKAQFEKMALYALIAAFPEKEALHFGEAEGTVSVNKELFDQAAWELYGIDMESAASYCPFFTLNSAGDEYVFPAADPGTVIPQSAAHSFEEGEIRGIMCLTENGTWIDPYEFDMFLMPVENGRFSRYRFSYLQMMLPESFREISTSRAEEERISVRLMAFLQHEPANAFLSHDFTYTEKPDGSISYTCDGVQMTASELSGLLCPDGEETDRVRVELGSIFKNGDHYIADYGKGLLEVKLTEDREFIFLRNKRYKNAQ